MRFFYLKDQLPPRWKRLLRPLYRRWKYRHAAKFNQEKLHMADNIRWGILASGGIAEKFAEGLTVVPDATLVAIGSRSQASADRFGDQFGVPHRHASYEALAADPEVDIIYVATPHPYHYENTLLCLDNGKAVLCEKPFAINADDSRGMVEAARAKNLFLMEAMWTAFIPVIVEVQRLIAEGAIGEPRTVNAHFGFRGDFNPEGRWFNRELGGGALLDVGIYPITFASIILGTQPVSLHSDAYIGSTGVDEQSAYIMKYQNGELAVLSSSVGVQYPNDAIILGTEGSITVHNPFWNASRFTLKSKGTEKVIEPPREGNGYNYEAIEAMACLRRGEIESPRWPLQNTLDIMDILDRLREPWGLRYPGE
jgi:predicted dehydrogenase